MTPPLLFNPRRRPIHMPRRRIRRQRLPGQAHDLLAHVLQAFPGPVEVRFRAGAVGFQGCEVALGLREDGAELLVHLAGSGDGAAKSELVCTLVCPGMDLRLDLLVERHVGKDVVKEHVGHQVALRHVEHREFLDGRLERSPVAP